MPEEFVHILTAIGSQIVKPNASKIGKVFDRTLYSKWWSLSFHSAKSPKPRSASTDNTGLDTQGEHDDDDDDGGNRRGYGGQSSLSKDDQTEGKESELHGKLNSSNFSNG